MFNEQRLNVKLITDNCDIKLNFSNIKIKANVSLIIKVYMIQ